jgi:hypothetical protein
MSRITGSEVSSMMEAYNAVYAPQITEQQIQEDFENWVYSLVNEGEDLSEYSWDEVYEVYNYINAEQLDEIAPALAAPLVWPAIAAGTTALVGGAAKLAQDLQKRKSASQNTPDEERWLNTGSFQSKTNEPEKGTKPPKSNTSRIPSSQITGKPPTGQKPAVTNKPQRLQAPKPPSPGVGVNPPWERPGAGGGNQPPEPPKPPKPSQPAASIGLRQAAKQAAGKVADVAKQAGGKVADVAKSGPGKTVLKYGVGVPATLGGGTLATVDVKRAASGQSSATQRLGGALVGGTGDAIKTTGSVSSGIPGIKDTGTPRETQQTGEWLKNMGSNIQKDVDRKLSNEKGTKLQLPVYNSYLFDLNNNEYINEAPAPVLGKRGNKWISVTTDPSGKKTETQVAPTPQAIQRYNSLATQKAKQQPPAAKPPAAKPAAPRAWDNELPYIGSPRAAELKKADQLKNAADDKRQQQISADVKAGRRVNPTEANPEGDPRLASKGTPGVDKALAHWKAQRSSKPEQSSTNNGSSPTTQKPQPAPASTPAATKPAPTPTPTPSKPAIERSPQGYSVGTTAGGTKFERRAATGDELRAAQAARAAGKGEEGAIKAGVAASKPETRNFAQKASQLSLGSSQFKPATTSQASNAASSTSPIASGSVAPATNKIAASSSTGTTPLKPVSAPPTPTQQTSTKPGDGKPYKDGPLWDSSPKPSPKPSSAPLPPITNGAPLRKEPLWDSYQHDAYDLVLEYLLNNGHVDTLDEALYVMMEMDVETIGTIVEGGFNSSGRYDVGGGRTVGPVAGAIRSLVTGNLPKQKTYIPPSPRQGTNTSPAVPPSKDDSGKSTDFGAGGGKAKMKTGMTVGQVERQGRMNKGDYSG